MFQCKNDILFTKMPQANSYLKKHWTKDRLVCILFDAFCMTIPNMVTIFWNLWIILFLFFCFCVIKVSSAFDSYLERCFDFHRGVRISTGIAYITRLGPWLKNIWLFRQNLTILTQNGSYFDKILCKNKPYFFNLYLCAHCLISLVLWNKLDFMNV